MRRVFIHCEIEVPFHPYEKESLNKKAERSIKRWVKDTLTNHASYIPMYVEESEGSFIEDVSRKTTIKVLMVEQDA